ncbi:hypothetical protein [Sulfitobacter sediminilitoris]
MHEGNYSVINRVICATTLWVMVSSSVVIAGIFALNSVVEWRTGEIITFAIFILPLLGITAICNGILKGIGRPAIAEAASRIIPPIVMISGMSLLWYLATATAMMGVFLQIASFTLVSIISVWLVNLYVPKRINVEYPDTASLGTWGKALFSLTAINGISMFGAQVAIIVLGILGNQDQVAFFRVAERGAQLVNFPMLFINAILGPHIVRTLRDGDLDDLHKIARTAARMTAASSAPVALTLIFFGKPLIALTFGPNYVDQAYLPLVVMCGAQFVSATLGSVGMFLIFAGHEKLHIWVQLLAALATTIALVSLVGKYQAFGGALAMSIGLLLLNIFLAVLVRRKLGFRPGIL